MADNTLSQEPVLDEHDLMNATESGTEVSKCPSCGSNLRFSPSKLALECDHCGTLVKVALDKFSEEIDFAKLLDGTRNTWSEDVRVFRCTNCGAKEILSKTEIAKNCAFCGTTNVVETDELSGLKPNAVLPFLLEKDAASSNIITWAKKKLFAPGKFKKSVDPQELYGNYTPAFTFDTITQSSYRGRLGKYYYVTVTRNGKTTSERRTEWFNVSGNYRMDFDDILIQASTVIDQKTVTKISPFGTNNSQKYSKEFLHGFSASQYTKDGKQCWEEAKQIIQSRVRKAILGQYTHDVVDYLNINMTCNNITYKYILLPVYIGHCSYRKKLYNVYVNGQNGKVGGKTPLSPIRIGIAVLLGLAVLAGIGILVYLGLSG